MNNLKLFEKMNEIYYAKLKDLLSVKLNMKVQPTNIKFKDIDVKSEITSYISIYSLMADCLLKETNKLTDVEVVKERMKEDIKNACKSIKALFDNCVLNRIETNGYNKLEEYKQALFNEIMFALTSLKEENTISREQEK